MKTVKDLLPELNPFKITGSYGAAWEILRALALQASNYTCQKCGQHNSNLVLHHRDNCALNNELSNLQVLCIRCHADTLIGIHK